MRVYLFLSVIMILTPAISSQALAQSSRDVVNRLNRIETEIETLSRALYRGEQPPPGSFGGGVSTDTANIEIRLQQLESEIRTLTGRVEEVSYESRQLREQLEKITSDFNLRLSDLEGARGRSPAAGNFGAAPAAPSPAQVPAPYTASPSFDNTNTQAEGNQAYQFSTSNLSASETQDDSNGFQAQQLDASPAQTASLASGDPAIKYENAFSLLKNANYAAAEQEFQSFLDQYSDHILAGNAKYWLGETYYVRGEYEQAARVFAEGYQQYPDGSKAADNLLKLGLSLAAVGNKTDACVALRQLQQGNMQGAGPVLRRAEQEIAKLGC